MELLSRLFRRWRSRPQPDADGRTTPRAGGRPPPSNPTEAATTTLIDELTAKATDQATEIDASSIDRIAARVVKRGYQGVPDVVAFPVSADRIIQVSKRDDGDINPLVHAISQDAAVTASLITVANSAASAPTHPITTPRDAVLRLGAAEATRVALAVAMRAMYKSKHDAGGSGLRKQFFADSLADAFSAAWLADALHLPGAERAFVLTMVRELARPAALTILESELPDDAGKLGVPETVAVVDAAAPMVARSLGEALKLPEGLDEALSPSTGGASALIHCARLVASVGALLRFAPRPPWWAAQAHGAALYLELRPATLRATITKREEDGRIAERIATPG